MKAVFCTFRSVLLHQVCTFNQNHLLCPPELKAAIDCYLTEYGKYLPDLVRSKSSYQNYREFMLKVPRRLLSMHNLPVTNTLPVECTSHVTH